MVLVMADGMAHEMELQMESAMACLRAWDMELQMEPVTVDETAHEKENL